MEEKLYAILVVIMLVLHLLDWSYL